MERTKICIVSGKLANAMLSSNVSSPSFEFVKWGTSYHAINEKCILIHSGSGRQLNECIAFCARTKSVLIELSTGLETSKMSPDFPLVICPNTSILLVKTLRMMKIFGSSFEDYDISITESHQSTKITAPGTAYNFADALKVRQDKIISIRDPQIQKNKIGIPQEFLGRHSYHSIVIKDTIDELTIETKVLGHNSYVNGVHTIVETCINNRLENKRHTVLDLIDDGML